MILEQRGTTTTVSALKKTSLTVTPPTGLAIGDLVFYFITFAEVPAETEPGTVITMIGGESWSHTAKVEITTAKFRKNSWVYWGEPTFNVEAPTVPILPNVETNKESQMYTSCVAFKKGSFNKTHPVHQESASWWVSETAGTTTTIPGITTNQPGCELFAYVQGAIGSTPFAVTGGWEEPASKDSIFVLFKKRQGAAGATEGMQHKKASGKLTDGYMIAVNPPDEFVSMV
jgi:hypothetical protein